MTGIRRSSAGLTAPLLLLLATLSGAPEVCAQEETTTGPAGTFGEVVDVDLVTLDVVATDRDGNPVYDLRAEEIEVREDGEPVELVSFEPPEPPKSAPASSASDTAPTGEPTLDASPREWSSTTEEPLNLVVFVDNLHIGGADRDRFLQELWSFLQAEVEPETRILVAGYGGELAFLTDFTTDREAVRAALAESLRSPALQMLADQDQRMAIRAVHDRQRAAIETPFEDPCPPDLATTAAHFAEEARDRASRAVNAVRFVVATLGGIDGRTALLHASAGLPLVPGQPILDFAISLCDGPGAMEGVQYAIDVYALGSDRYSRMDPAGLRMEMSRFSIQPELARVSRLATANRVRLFTFQVSPPPSGGAEAVDGLGKLRTSFGRFQETRNAEDSLFYLAEETGGRAYLAGSGFGLDLREMHEHLTASYSLSYRSPAPRDGESHRIEVRTSRPGIRILHPAHRTSKSVEDEIGDRLLAALHHGVTKPPDDAVLRADRPSEGGPPTRLRLHVPTDTVTLPLPDGGRHGMLELYVVTKDPEGRTSPFRKRVHPVQIPAEATVPPTIALEIEMGFDLTGHHAAVAIHDRLQGTVWTLLAEN